MSVGATSRLNGSFGVVGPTVGEKQERELVDEDRLTPEEKEALEADDFIIYGKASVERYDEDTPSQKLDMKAFEDQLGDFIEDGVISRRHKDIKVGEPLESYTLDDPATIYVGGDAHEFGAGDALETRVEDDELWIVANIKNDSEFARDTRIGTLNGNLDGFSVTIFCKEWENTPEGQYVTDFDWHSVTIGSDEQIKNPDSRYGLVAYKGEFDLSPAEQDAVLGILAGINTKMSETEDSKGFWQKLESLASQKANDEESKDTPPEDSKEEADDEGPEDSKEEESPEDSKEGDYEGDEDEDEKQGDYDEEEDEDEDVDKVMEQVKQELGDDAAATIRKAMEEVPVPDEDEDEEQELDEGELKSIAGKLAEAGGFVTAEDLEEKLEGAVRESDLEEKLAEALPDGEVATKEDISDVVEATEKAITEAVPDIVEGTAEKMEVAGTPSPSQGSADDREDYLGAIQERFGTAGGD